MATGVELVALVIALVAFVVALLQMMQQYGSSSSSAKVNAAAIGSWASKNRLRWSAWEWKFHCEYRRPHLSSEIVIDKLHLSGLALAKLSSALGPFNPTQHFEFSDSRDGLRLVSRPHLIIQRDDDPEGPEVSINNLPWRFRRAARSLEKAFVMSFTRPMPCRASWCELTQDIGIDLDDLPSDAYLDAGAIPSTLDAPYMEIRLSDLVRLGFLLNMEVMEVDEQKHVVNMTSPHCFIATRDMEGVGKVAHYSGTAAGIQPPTRLANSLELSVLLDTASGKIQVGDSRGPWSYWGYNSVDAVLAAVINSEDRKGGSWQEIRIKDAMASLEGDSHRQWRGKWSKPTVPSTAFLLSLCGNMAVANSFPHQLLRWAPEPRRAACIAASDLVDRTIGFIQAPPNLFRVIKQMDVNILKAGKYKAADNYGCEFGGLRSWLSTNMSEFTLRVSGCWQVSALTNSVPILIQLLPILREGHLDRNWCEMYDSDTLPPQAYLDAKNEKSNAYQDLTSEDTSLSANSLLWMQISMLDTWIAQRIDIMVGETGLDEVAVPSDMKNASSCARRAQDLKQTTGWKLSRMQFTRQYLLSLAEGVTGTERIAVSCMAIGFDPDGAAPALGQSSWSNMAFGKAEDWAAIDAVLTLRSLLMITRLEHMHDSSALLRLQRFDPVVLLA